MPRKRKELSEQADHLKWNTNMLFTYLQFFNLCFRWISIERELSLLKSMRSLFESNFLPFLKIIIKIKCQAWWIVLSNSLMKTFWRFWVLFSLEMENQGRHVTSFSLRDWLCLSIPTPCQQDYYKGKTIWNLLYWNIGDYIRLEKGFVVVVAEI